MFLRLAAVSLATVAAGTTVLAGAAGAAGLGPLPPLPLLSGPDTLTVKVADSGYPDADGTFELTCDDQAGGNHPARDDACARLAELAKQGVNPFKAVPEGASCTQVYGGPAVADVTGTWQGRKIDAHFSRANGCEIDRWQNLEPLLPIVRG